jgi:hypothetical protein
MSDNNNLREWIENHPVPDEMIWKGAAEHQMNFFLQEIMPLFSAGFSKDANLYRTSKEPSCQVISTHHSKSIELPVVMFNRPDLNLTIIIRDNFYNIMISVISSLKPIVADFDNLFITDGEVDEEGYGGYLHPVYFEGFPEKLVFSYYARNNFRFSAQIGSREVLKQVINKILACFGIPKQLSWTKEKPHGPGFYWIYDSYNHTYEIGHIAIDKFENKWQMCVSVCTHSNYRNPSYLNEVYAVANIPDNYMFYGPIIPQYIK